MKIQVNNKEYQVEKLLGKGKGGYSYLATDGENNYVVKKIHHEPCSYYKFGDKLQSEMSDYKRLTNIGINLPKMYDVDFEREHILKEYIEGDTIYDMVKEDKDVSDSIVQLKEMCKKLYAANTNIDYFPTNFIPSNGKLYYIDYECNDYMEEWNFENWGILYWSKTKEYLGYLNKDAVKNFFQEGYVNHNYNKVIEVISKDYIDHSPAGAKGNEGAVEILKIVEGMFNDLSLEVLDVFEEGGMVATRIKYSGIHSGECMGISGSGKKITFEALENFKVENGVITESWGYWPDLDIKRQIEG